MMAQERKPEDLSGAERELLLARMDRVDALSEARMALKGREYRPEIKARYLEALGGLHDETRAAFNAYRRDVGLGR
jgi:hypothetical protein